MFNIDVPQLDYEFRSLSKKDVIGLRNIVMKVVFWFFVWAELELILPAGGQTARYDQLCDVFYNVADMFLMII